MVRISIRESIIFDERAPVIFIFPNVSKLARLLTASRCCCASPTNTNTRIGLRSRAAEWVRCDGGSHKAENTHIQSVYFTISTIIMSIVSSCLFLLVTVAATLVDPTKSFSFEVSEEVYSNGRFFDGACVANVTDCFLQQRYDSVSGIYSNEGDSFACLAPTNTDMSNPDFDSDDTLTLCDCNEENGFFLDLDPVTSAGVFRWTADESICLQAGHEDVQDGTKIRLYPCDWSEPRQVLWYVSDGQVRLTSNPTLCMVPQGSEVDMCQSKVIVKECEKINPERRSWQFRTRETLIRQSLAPIVVREDAPFPDSELQSEALSWLVYEDMAKIPEGPEETYQLLQRYISALLYFGTDGPNWFNSSLWLSNTTVCEWDGVVCSAEDDLDLINSYILNSNGLVGALQSELGTLSELTSLDFSENMLSGSLPDEIGNLVELSSLSLACNALTGDLPETLSNLIQLEDLCLNGNDFNSTALPGDLQDVPCLSSTEECPEFFDEVDVDVEISRSDNDNDESLLEQLWGN
jgi:Ricin-type beta-trefoil lectin domain